MTNPIVKRDVDLVLSGAASELDHLRAELAESKADAAEQRRQANSEMSDCIELQKQLAEVAAPARDIICDNPRGDLVVHYGNRCGRCKSCRARAALFALAEGEAGMSGRLAECKECGMPVAEGEFHDYTCCTLARGCPTYAQVRVYKKFREDIFAELAAEKERADKAEQQLLHYEIDVLPEKDREHDQQKSEIERLRGERDKARKIALRRIADFANLKAELAVEKERADTWMKSYRECDLKRQRQIKSIARERDDIKRIAAERVKELQDALAQLREQTRWVSVDERLPELAGIYRCDTYFRTQILTFRDGRWFSKATPVTERVRNWMHLPPAPEGEG